MIYLFSFAPSSHLNALSDLSNGMKNEDENIVWKQSAMQKDAARLKIQRQTIFEKFRSAPNSPSLPSFMLDAPQVDQLHAYILTKFVGFPIVVACMHSCFRRHSRRQTNKQHASSIAQRSPSSRMGGGGPPIRITSLRTSGSMMARPDSSLARQKAKIAELVESANNSIKTFRKTPKRLSLEALHSLFSLLPLSCFYSVHFSLTFFFNFIFMQIIA